MSTMYRGVYTNGKINLEPRRFYPLTEEQPVIVIPLRKKRRLKAYGILNKYANPSKINMEKEAFSNEILKKY